MCARWDSAVTIARTPRLVPSPVQVEASVFRVEYVDVYLDGRARHVMFVVLAVELHVMLMVFVCRVRAVVVVLNFVFSRPDRSCWVRLVTERPELDLCRVERH